MSTLRALQHFVELWVGTPIELSRSGSLLFAQLSFASVWPREPVRADAKVEWAGGNLMRALGFVRCFSLALLFLAIPASSFAGVFVSVAVAPPVLPVYEQPPCPGDGYMWTPGYWAYGPGGYYWVPGTWVMPPTVGLLWTPGYWGWGNGVYIWHAGYWGPHIGFYGGVNYGFGYFGNGYEGGYWRGRHFFYNRTVNNVTITNVHIYNRTVINNHTVNRVSYNGGRGGIEARPTHEQERWGHERHFEPTGRQREHEHSARENRAFRESENHGRPAIAATSRPGEFHGPNRGNDPRFDRDNNRPAPRTPNAARRDDRPMPRQEMRGHDDRQMQRQEMHGNRGNKPEYAAPRQEAPRPSAYHPENSRSENGRGRGKAPQQEKQDRPDRGRDKH
jgi:YXWGXW repeat-containing protein